MRTAIIGLGRMGLRHVQNARDLGLEIVGVCDAKPDALQTARAAAGFDPGQCFTHAEKLLSATRPACVIVATTAPSHCESTCQAAARGARFILCEKPMAVSLDQCDRMLSACAEAGARLAINHPMRYMDRFTEVKALLDAGEFGPLGSVTTVGANIGLAMNGSHRIEAFHYLTGEPPATVTARFSPEVIPNPRGPQFEDRAGSVHLISAGGKRLHLDLGADQGHGVVSVYSCRFGQILVDELDGFLSTNVRLPESRALPTTQYVNPARRNNRTLPPAEASAPSRAVLEALLRGANHPTGADGRAAVAVLVAAHVSDERGQAPVTVDESLPKARLFPWA